MVLLFVLVSLVVGVAAAYRQSRPRFDDEVFVVEKRDLERTVVATGKVEPAGGVVELSARMAGVVSKLFVEEGDVVAAGQVLAQLEAGELRAGVATAQAALAREQARLALLLAGTRAEDLRAARAAVEEARARRALWTDQLERVEHLRRGGGSTEEARDRARHEEEAAASRLEASRAALARLEAGPREEEIAEARAAVKLAQARVSLAEAELEKARLVSPLHGTVLRIYLEEGEGLPPVAQAPILALGDLSTKHLRVEIGEHDMARVAPGQQVWATVRAFGERRFDGAVLSVSPRMGRRAVFSGDPGERKDVQVREALVDLGPAPELPVGVRMTAHIIVGERQGVLAIPERYLARQAGKPVVYELDSRSGQIVEVPVETGLVSTPWVEIVRGLSEGDRIVPMSGDFGKI